MLCAKKMLRYLKVGMLTAICLESSNVRKWFINSFTDFFYVVLIGISQNAKNNDHTCSFHGI